MCSDGLGYQNLTFAQLVVGRYDCIGGGYTATITIFGELSYTMYFSIVTFPLIHLSISSTPGDPNTPTGDLTSTLPHSGAFDSGSLLNQKLF